jgi:Flp pilus assembly protein TadD
MNSRISTGLASFFFLLPLAVCASGTASGVGGGPGSPTETQEAAPSVASAHVDPQVWFAKGEAALNRGDLDGAEAAFRHVIAADPMAGAAYSNLGVIAMRHKNWDRALTLLQKAEKLEPAMPGIRLNIGLVKYRRGDYPGAVAPLASVVRDEPNSFQARYLLGLCYVFTVHYA